MFEYYYLNEFGRFKDSILDHVTKIKVFDERKAIHSEQIMAYGIIETDKEIPFEELRKNGLVNVKISEEEYLRGLLQWT